MNSLDANGLTLNDQATLIANLSAFLQSIYGPNIDVTSSSPDGQWINILVQGTLDIEDIIAETFASFDPDQAIGTVLWQRVGINGIQVQGGTFTTTPVSITVSQAVSLFGLDQTTNPVFYVTDNLGNRWNLITTQNIGTAGTYSFQFQAANPGALTVLPNTIIVPGLIVLGVTTINNPTTTGTVAGQNQETDAALRIRRQKSVQMPSQGFQAGTEAALGNIPGVTYAKVYENYGQANPPFSSPTNAMWAIVAGSATPLAIATAIYNNRTLGCNMKGAQTFNITQEDGSIFTVQWDNVAAQPVFIQFTASSIDGVNAPNLQAILQQLPTLFVPAIGQEINVNQMATFVQQIDPNCLVSNAGFSLSQFGPFTPTLTPTAKNNQLVVSTPNIYITPIVLLPQIALVPHGTNQKFTAYGGTQTSYVYSILVNNSGGTINATTGLYTAGATPGIDTVKAIDTNGNFATSTITVT